MGSLQRAAPNEHLGTLRAVLQRAHTNNQRAPRKHAAGRPEAHLTCSRAAPQGTQLHNWPQRSR
eukprot:2587503-Pyramimonas_sp.AAC.1